MSSGPRAAGVKKHFVRYYGRVASGHGRRRGGAGLRRAGRRSTRVARDLVVPFWASDGRTVKSIMAWPSYSPEGWARSGFLFRNVWYCFAHSHSANSQGVLNDTHLCF